MTWRKLIHVVILTPFVAVVLVVLLVLMVAFVLLLARLPIIIPILAAAWLSWIRVDDGRWPWQ